MGVAVRSTQYTANYDISAAEIRIAIGLSFTVKTNRVVGIESTKVDFACRAPEFTRVRPAGTPSGLCAVI